MLKPRVVFSACLNLERTRYDGNLIENPLATKLRNFCKVISVCPEVGIGLPVPREKIILYKENNKIRVIELSTGRDLTEDLKAFSDRFIKNLPEVEGFFLKSKSPSCGVSYNTKTFKDPEGKELYGKSQGIFAKKVLRTFPLLPVVDEEILKNRDELENFLIRIFSLKRLRELKATAKTKKDIVSFHKKAYYLLTSYEPASLRRIEELLFSKNTKFEELLKSYERLFKKALSSPLERGKQINTVRRILEKFSENFTEKEKSRIFSLLERYKKRKIPLIEVLSELKFFLQEKDKKIPELSFYLEPYPEELKELFY